MSIEGVPVHLIDTAGLRDAGDEIERIGIERTWRAVEEAGAALFISEANSPENEEEKRFRARLPQGMPVAHVVNKIDLTGENAASASEGGDTTFKLSAKTGAGVEALRGWFLQVAGWKPHGEGLFMARERHLRALEEAGDHLHTAKSLQAYELIAEELRLAQLALGRITGEVTADDLLGAIFSRFCLGK